MQSRFKWNSVPECSTRNRLQKLRKRVEWNGIDSVVPFCSSPLLSGTASGTHKKFRSKNPQTLDTISLEGGTGWNSVPEGGYPNG